MSINSNGTKWLQLKNINTMLKKVSYFSQILTFNSNSNNQTILTNPSDTTNELMLSSDDGEDEELDFIQRIRLYRSENGFCEFCGVMLRKPTLIERVNYVINKTGNILWLLLNPDKLKYSDYLPAGIKPIVKCTNANSNAASDESTTSEMPINKFLTNIFLFVINTVLKLIKLIVQAIVLVYFTFVLVCNLPFATIKNFIRLLKGHTGTDYVFMVPLKLPGALWNSLLNFSPSNFVRRTQSNVHNCRLKCRNTSNISNLFNMGNKKSRKYEKESCDTVYCTDPKKCFSMLSLIVGTFLYFYCSQNPESNICKIKQMYHSSTPQIMEYAHIMYLLPGEECMRAGRCCRGSLESVLRWGSCFTTFPIRVILGAFPRSTEESIGFEDVSVGIKMYIEKIMEELNQIKEDLAFEEESLSFIETKSTALEQRVIENEGILNKIQPKLAKAESCIDSLDQDIAKHEPLIKEITTIRSDAYKMVNDVRNDAKDTLELISSTMQRLRTSTDAERQRLVTQIDNLEKQFIDEAKKTKQKNSQLSASLQFEFDQIKKMQHDLRLRLQPMSDITLRYKELEDTLIRDLRNRLNEEMTHHEQMSKRSLKICYASSEELLKELEKIQTNLVCFINASVHGNAGGIKSKVIDEIRSEMDERTRQIARISIDHLLIKQKELHDNFPKTEKKHKKCGLYPKILVSNSRSTRNPICMNTKSKTEFCPYLCPNFYWKVIQNNTSDTRDVVDKIIANFTRFLSCNCTGQPDYPLWSPGSSIVINETSETYFNLFGYYIGKITKKVKGLLGFPRNNRLRYN